MALIPFATKLLIPPGSSDPMITARMGIFHVDAGNAESLYNWFNGPSGGIESHAFIKKTGDVEQYRDTSWQADANYLANDWAISFETQGFGDGTWTEEQLAMIKRCIRWGNRVHSIPLRLPQHYNGAGWGYHTLFPEWSNVPGKTCPGPQRIQQFHDIIVPWMKDGAPPEPGPTPNITDALHAKTLDDRVVALRKVVRRGDDKAAQVAAKWLKAINNIKDAQAAASELRIELKDLEIKVN